uniref:Retrotransposon protein, putative, Ty1-copia subclass n=1 Tax=Tanacetum cinerariifolium TaxID=118510 RepID=A0A6L2KAS4_TANCI|nr:hypothetical protein [Tanacetum cinerariifolium]
MRHHHHLQHHHLHSIPISHTPPPRPRQQEKGMCGFVTETTKGAWGYISQKGCVGLFYDTKGASGSSSQAPGVRSFGGNHPKGCVGLPFTEQARVRLAAIGVRWFVFHENRIAPRGAFGFGFNRNMSVWVSRNAQRVRLVVQERTKVALVVHKRQLGVVVVRPVNTRHRWDETCLLDIIVIKSTDVVGPISLASPTDSKYLCSEMRYMIHNEVACLRLGRKKVGELHAMLIEYEKGLPKKAETPKVMMIKGGKIQKSNKKSLKDKGKGKANGKRKDKRVYIPKPKNPKPSAKDHPAKDDTCHHCKEVGHCKRNCPAYLAELIKKKQVGTASSSDVFIIELFSFLTKSWVYDTSCGTHIYNTKHGLGGVRKLKQVEAIVSFDLDLPNRLMICLDNCHYAPSITRGVVSVHHLVENGFVQRFTNYGISVSKNDVIYFNVIARKGIYEIDMHNLVPNVNSIYNVSTKRAKHNLDSTYLWYSRLAHISKMTRKLFPHRPERAADLLGIIHTDVCGPLRHASRQGASYFITFTDDYSHYGYVYILKHKHELTPPYTPQHNDVSKRRNHTLLDMVRSMMNLTTLSLSSWDYALESVTHIINMVPTKKALVKRDTPNKLQQRSVKCIFIGYPKETMGYYFNFPPKTKIVVASKIPMKVEGFEPPQEEVISVRRSERTHRAPTRLCLNVEVDEHSLRDLKESASYKAAMLDSESNNKWRFKKKTDMDGIVHTYKARLMAKGYTQLYGVDYEETLLPVADIRAIRILISIEAFYDYEIWQMDVKTTFLNGYLDEDIYTVQPEGFVDPKNPRKVCKLQRSIYGLKQASRSWNKRFDEEIKRFGFTQNLDESCVYQKASGSNVTFRILYVDDIIIMGNHILSLQSVKDYLGKCFAMKDLRKAAFILRIKIYRDRNPKAELRVDCYCNAGSALLIANEPEVQKGARHYHRRCHYVRECIELSEINLLKVHTDDNLADPLTKALPKGKLTQHARSMELRLASSFI